eukprot:g15490.t2
MASLSDLPPGWEAKEIGGRMVYINHNTKTTQWERPAVPEDSLPQGWGIQVVDGRIVYLDHINKRTTYIRPTATVPAGSAVADKRRSPGSSPASGAGAYGSSGGVGDEEEPLPPGWSAKTTADGKTYYEDHANKSTTWYRPASVPAAAAGAAAAAAYTKRELRPVSGLSTDSNSRRVGSSSTAAVADGDKPLPPGWSAKTTAGGATYFENHITRTGSWSPPVASVTSSVGSVGSVREAPLPPGWEEEEEGAKDGSDEGEAEAEKEELEDQAVEFSDPFAPAAKALSPSKQNHQQAAAGEDNSSGENVELMDSAVASGLMLEEDNVTSFKGAVKKKLDGLMKEPVHELFPAYITVMVCNGKTIREICSQLEDLLAAETAVMFCKWLSTHLSELQRQKGAESTGTTPAPLRHATTKVGAAGTAPAPESGRKLRKLCGRRCKPG